MTFAALVLINTYGPPETDIVVTYQGSEETMLVDVTTHFGAVGNHELVRGKYDLISSGTGLRHARVAWKRTVDSKEQEKFFDLKSDIPTYGKDRVVLISIYDDKATCEVRLGRWPR